jgi:hypothetical protein
VPFQVACHHCGAVSVWQAAQFLIDDRPEIVKFDSRGCKWFHGQLLCSSAGDGIPPAPGDVHRNSVQPVSELIPRANRFRLAQKHHKHRLKGVVGISFVAKHTPAHPADHRAVSADDCRECVFGHLRNDAPGPAVREEIAEQTLVGVLTALWWEPGPQSLDEGTHVSPVVAPQARSLNPRFCHSFSPAAPIDPEKRAK